MIPNYTRHVFWYEPDKAWFATSPEFPELSAFGDTPAEALAEFEVVLEESIRIYEQEGWPLPQPGTVPSGLPGWSYLVLIVVTVGLIWLALRLMPAGW